MVTATITSENGAAIAVSQFGVSVVHPEGITSIWARLSSEQRHALAGALQGREPGDEFVDWKAMHLDAEVKRRVLGEMLRGAERERDAAVERAENLEREFAEFKGNANRLNVRAVDRDVVEAELVEGLYRGFTANQLMQRVCAAIDDDPAALIITEKSLPTVNHPSRWRNFDLADGTWRFRDATDEEIREALETVESDLRFLLVVSRAVEAEQAADPVEDQTDALADILYGDDLVTDQMRGVLERVVRAGMLFPGLEADQ